MYADDIRAYLPQDEQERADQRIILEELVAKLLLAARGERS